MERAGAERRLAPSEIEATRALIRRVATSVAQESHVTVADVTDVSELDQSMVTTCPGSTDVVMLVSFSTV